MNEAAVVIQTCNDGDSDQESDIEDGKKGIDLQKIQELGLPDYSIWQVKEAEKSKLLAGLLLVPFVDIWSTRKSTWKWRTRKRNGNFIWYYGLLYQR